MRRAFCDKQNADKQRRATTSAKKENLQTSLRRTAGFLSDQAFRWHLFCRETRGGCYSAITISLTILQATAVEAPLIS